MIIRHIPMKTARLSNFSGLVQYITNEQNKQERVGTVRITHCNSIDPVWAVHEIQATQEKNQRAKGDKTYHLLISFAPGETPPEDVLRVIEDRVAESIGFKEHQRISAIHHDTDNLHIHVAINKIHPKTLNMIEPYRAYKAFAEVASSLEVEYGLIITNHQTRKGRSENLADDMEQHAGIVSLINWMKRNCSEQIESANSWRALHKLLAEHGLSMKVRANGFVFCDTKGLTIKASSVSRQFSKKNLEDKLGAFEPSPFRSENASTNIYRYEPLNKEVIGSELYARYQEEKSSNKIICSQKLKHLRTAKARLIQQAKKRARMKRKALKLMHASRTQKKYLYQHISKTLLNDIAKIRKNYANEHTCLIDKHQNRTWADWLQYKAQLGDKDALTALRYRNRKKQNQYTLSAAASTFPLVDFKAIDSLTKEGTEIYKIKQAVIRNTGKEIKISKGVSIDALKKAIEMAQAQYGHCIQVNGSPLFRQAIIQTTVHHNINITFADPTMETHRKKLIIEKEKHHEQTKRTRSNNRTRTPRSHEVVRTTPGEGRGKRGKTKPDPFTIRQGTPTQNQNSLRNLSQLNMVQLAARSEVLLQVDVHDKLEHEGVEPDNHVRRKVFGMKKLIAKSQ